MKSYVASPQEVAAIKAVIAKPRFVSGEMLSITAATDPDWLASVIPAPLEPDGDSVRFMIGRWQSNCVADYCGAGVYVPARLGDLGGEYVLAMYMDSDAAILYGREVFGEPKKQAFSVLRRNGTVANGWVERGGVRILHIEGDLTVDEGPVETTGVNFNIKATPACDGSGLQSDAIVTVAEFDVRFGLTKSGRGGLSIASTEHDPLGSIPLGEIRGATYQEGDLFASSRVVATIPAKDFEPYFFARIDDYALMDTESPTLIK